MAPHLIRRQIDRARSVLARNRKTCQDVVACVLGLTIGAGMGVLVVVGLPRHPAPPVQTPQMTHQAGGAATHARLNSKTSAASPLSML